MPGAVMFAVIGICNCRMDCPQVENGDFRVLHETPIRRNVVNGKLPQLPGLRLLSARAVALICVALMSRMFTPRRFANLAVEENFDRHGSDRAPLTRVTLVTAAVATTAVMFAA